MTYFKPLAHQEDADYVMVSTIADQARGIKHVHTGKYWYDYLVVLLSLKNGQL